MSTQIASPSLPDKPIASARTYVWAGILVVGVALALVAQFVLDGLADGNDAWHWAQHASLFWSGLMVGASVLRLYQVGLRAA